MSYPVESVLSIYDFIKQTPENNLRKMLVDAQLTESHFRILMKLAKGSSESDFVDSFQNESFGKLRLSAKESPIKETLWPICKKKMISLGLLPKDPIPAKDQKKPAA